MVMPALQFTSLSVELTAKPTAIVALLTLPMCQSQELGSVRQTFRRLHHMFYPGLPPQPSHRSRPSRYHRGNPGADRGIKIVPGTSLGPDSGKNWDSKYDLSTVSHSK